MTVRRREIDTRDTKVKVITEKRIARGRERERENPLYCYTKGRRKEEGRKARQYITLHKQRKKRKRKTEIERQQRKE